MTVNELIREIRKPGKIEMPVIHEHGVMHIVVDKSDLIHQLTGMTGKAPWCFYKTHPNGIRRLDINN